MIRKSKMKKPTCQQHKRKTLSRYFSENNKASGEYHKKVEQAKLHLDGTPTKKDIKILWVNNFDSS